MSIEPEPHNLEKLLINPGDAAQHQRQATSGSDQVAELQDQVQDLDNKIKEERFLWILVATIVFDTYFFVQMDNWAGAIVVGILQLIGLIVLAQKCRVDPIMPLIDKIGGFLNARKP
jgi:hypothetical protein